MIGDDKSWLTITFTSDLHISMSQLINFSFEKKTQHQWLLKWQCRLIFESEFLFLPLPSVLV